MPPKYQEQLKKKNAQALEKKGHEQYQSYVTDTNKAPENITEGTIRVTEKERLKSRGEELRYLEKARLKNLLNEYSEDVQGDPKLDYILEAVRYYAGMDVTSSSGGYAEENKVVNGILSALRSYQKELDKQALESKHDNLTDYARQNLISSLITQMEYNTDGNLEITDPKGLNKEDRDPNAYYVDGTKAPFAPKSESSYIDIKRKDRPLFPHEPCANDISQGALGDCYFVASLAEIAERQPEKIKEAMKDNGDGTVTVRFYAAEKGENKKYIYKPVYVTVDKVVPSTVLGREDAYAEDCIWVQTLERAYTASGLYVYQRTAEASKLGFFDDKEAVQQRPVPENIAQMYQDYKSGKVKPIPTNSQCPWLVDREGNLHEWNPSYTNMEGGFGGYAMQAFLGPDYVPATYSFWDEKEEYFFRDKKTNEVRPDDGIIVDIFRNIFLENKQIDTDRSEILKYKRLGVSERDMANVAMMYEKIMGEPCPLSPIKMGDADYPAPDLVGHPEITLMFELFSDVGTKIKDIVKETGNFGDDFIKRFNDEKTGLHSVVENVRKKFIKTDKTLDMDKLFDGFEKEISTHISNLNTKYAVYPKYSGRYNGLEQDLLRRVQESRAEGRMMLCATGEEGKQTDLSFGLRKTHQYTAIDAVQKTVNGKDLWFIRLRNPHAQNVMKYEVANGTMVPKASERGEEGYFDIELSDFANNFTEFIYGEPTPERKAELEKQRLADEAKKNSDPDAPEDLSDDQINEIKKESKKLHAYDRALESIQKALEGTHSSLSSDSQQFKDLETAIHDARNYLAGVNTGSNPSSGEKPELSEALNKIKTAADAYMQHTSEVKRSGSRRAERVEICKAVNKLIEFGNNGVPDPKLAMKEELADRLLNCAKNALTASKNPADKTILGKFNSEQFVAEKKAEIVSDKKNEKHVGSDFVSLFRNTGQPDKNLLKIASKVSPKPAAKAPAKEINNAQPERQEKAMKSGLY